MTGGQNLFLARLGEKVKAEENAATVGNTHEEGLWNSLAQGISFS